MNGAAQTERNNEDQQTPLFRSQALSHKRRSLYGRVILKRSVSYWAILILTGLSLAIGLWLAFGITIEPEQISLWHWLNSR